MKTFVHTKVCKQTLIAVVFIHNGPEVGIQMSSRMQKQNVVCLYNGKLFVNKRKRSRDTYCNMDEPEKHHSKQRKSVIKDDMSYGSMFMKRPEKANL